MRIHLHNKLLAQALFENGPLDQKKIQALLQNLLCDDILLMYWCITQH